jgi:CopG family nickel-responsive transcriptional regulator
MEPKLLARFDKASRQAGYSCRSEAIRDLIRRRLAEEELKLGRTEAVGTITLVYDHEQHNLSHKLTHLQHHHHAEIASTVHVHLDPRNCLEVLVVRGRADRIRRIADELIAVKGVKHGRLTLTTAGNGSQESGHERSRK